MSMRKCLCFMMCILATSAMAFGSVSPSSTCPRQFQSFLHDLNSECPSSIPFSVSPIQHPPIFFWRVHSMADRGMGQVDGESFERAVSSSQKNEYIAVLFYASWCPFSSIFQAKFYALSSMYPRIKHLMVEQSSAMPSVFSRYGIRSVPSILIVDQTTRVRYYGRKDLRSLINFYRKTTGMDAMVDMVEDTSNKLENDLKAFQLWRGATLKETFLREPYLALAAVFVVSRAFLYFFPEIASRLAALWVACIPHLNLGIFEESRQLIGRVLCFMDVKRVWSKLKVCKTRNFHKGARNARVWASSLASVSLGETSSSRVFPSRDL